MKQIKISGTPLIPIVQAPLLIPELLELFYFFFSNSFDKKKKQQLQQQNQKLNKVTKKKN